MSEQVKRARSPNYPAISLPEALGQLRLLFDRINRHPAPKEAVLRGLGYGGWNGASATALSAHGKYGLLERVPGEQYRNSNLGMRLMFHQTPTEYAEALSESARLPPLFNELLAEYPGPLPHDDILRPRLIRRGFAPSAVSTVIQAFRDTMEFVRDNAAGYPMDHQNRAEDTPVQTQEAPQTSGHQAPTVGRATSESAGTWLEEQILDDDGNCIVMKFPTEPTVETYEFLKDYLDFRVARMRKALAAKMDS